LALVAGEKNLIIDVDVSDLATQFRHVGARHLPFDGDLPQEGGSFRNNEKLTLLESRVQAMVEYVSVLLWSSLSACVN
jgi:hypothetical protein